MSSSGLLCKFVEIVLRCFVFFFFAIQKLAEALAVNKTLRSVNVESNFLSGEVIVELVKAINVNQILLELRVANQVFGLSA